MHLYNEGPTPKTTHDMKNILYISVASLLLAVVACDNGGKSEPDPVPVKPAEPIALTQKQLEKAAGDNTFAFKLFREVATSDDKENAFISPLSVTMALGMLYNGTSEGAGKEMAGALGMAGFTDGEINAYYQTMQRALLAADPLTAMSIANSIWSERTYPVKQSFIDVNRTWYGAEVQSLDFGAPSTVTAINNWCAAKTNDKIKSIIDEIPEAMVMYLINAVYFKSKWESQFDKEDTRDEDFTLEGGAKKTVRMMNQTETFPYYGGDAVECLELPYGNGAFSMLVMMPAGDKTLDELVEKLDADIYKTISDGLSERKVRVKLPRFKQECMFSLIEPVADLGMKLIFQNGGNLNGIADDPRLVVSEIKHKTFVEVNEEGTEAAAVTIIGAEPTSVPEYGTFYADRPFIYLIKEKSTGAILFIGRMDEPKI